MVEQVLIPPSNAKVAPPWSVEQWFNAPQDFGLETLRGRVVALHAFQMLCPGCVAHGLPQAQNIESAFRSEHVAVVGLHTVFEHHDAMKPVSLAAFLHEYRIGFPVGVDLPSKDEPTPQTMMRYRLRGTPSLLLVDREGRLRYHAFGRPSDMSVGAAVAALVAETTQPASVAPSDTSTDPTEESNCSDDGCEIPSESRA